MVQRTLRPLQRRLLVVLATIALTNSGASSALWRAPPSPAATVHALRGGRPAAASGGKLGSGSGSGSGSACAGGDTDEVGESAGWLGGCLPVVPGLNA